MHVYWTIFVWWQSSPNTSIERKQEPTRKDKSENIDAWNSSTASVIRKKLKQIISIRNGFISRPTAFEIATINHIFREVNCEKRKR